jgi:hypothetical protein
VAAAANPVSHGQEPEAGPQRVPQVTLSVQIPDETDTRLAATAEATGHSPGYLVDQALRAYLVRLDTAAD